VSARKKTTETPNDERRAKTGVFAGMLALAFSVGALVITIRGF
jgi:hypothetical protein